MHEVLRTYTDLIEPLSIDEAYLDVTENKKRINSATVIAHSIQKDVYEKQTHLFRWRPLISFSRKWLQVIISLLSDSHYTENAKEFIRAILMKISMELESERWKLKTGGDINRRRSLSITPRKNWEEAALFTTIVSASNEGVKHNWRFIRNATIGTERTLIKDTTDHGILTGYLASLHKN